MSDSLKTDGLEQTRLPCPSLSPRVCSNSCPLSQWCYPTISSSAVPFSWLQLSQHQGLFQWVSQLLALGGQSIRASASVLPVGCFERTALKHVYYLGWNRSPAQAGCMRQVFGPGALGRPRGIGWRGRWEGGLGWGIHVNPCLIHVNVWKNHYNTVK